MKLAYAEQMRQLDESAIKTYGIPGIVLMENAGVGTVQAINENYGDLHGRTVAIIAGPGNNGGDGLVIGRHILQQGGFPVIFLLAGPKKIRGDAGINLKIIGNLDIPIYPLTTRKKLSSLQNFLPNCDLVIDAIFGTGLQRKVAGLFADAITLVNQALVPVISVDIPSGLDSDTGLPLGSCVEADLTVTYGLAKPGHFTGIGPEMCGRLGIVDIGLPPAALEEADLQTEVLEDHTVAEYLPERSTFSHKGTYGHLLVIGGSRGKTGAALLCARGALRSGCGLVTVGLPGDLDHIVPAALPEAMSLALSTSGQGYADIKDYQTISKTLAGKQAMVIGPGLGQAKPTGQLVARLYREELLPMVIDADGLNLLATSPEGLAEPPAPRILTPHPGEMARLTGKKNAEVQANRLAAAKELAVANGVYVVLKGAGTIIAGPDGRAAINSSGNPLLAAGGSGDVLAGMIGSLLAQGLPAWEACCLAVYTHGLAADHLAEDRNVQSGLLASEFADQLPTAFAELLNNEEDTDEI